MTNLRLARSNYFKRIPIPILSCIFALFFIVPHSVAETTVGGTISTDTTWSLSESPYMVTSSITVKGTDGADAVTTLTIEPGVEIRFNNNLQLNVGASSGDPGALIAQGTEADPIIFTSSQPTPTPGNWRGIKFLNTTDDASTILAHCTIQYAGYGSQGQIYAYNSAPNMSNCTFANSSNYDLYYTGTVGGTVSGCTLNSGIRLLATSTVEFTGNTFTQNNSYPIRAYADNVHNLVNGNSFEGLDENSHLEINGGNVTKDATWTGDIPYLMAATMAVRGTDGTDGITTLSIAPGAELRFNHYLQLNVGASSGDPGALIAQGTEADPIIFTSSQPTPTPGNWRGIKFLNTTDDASTILAHCTIQYAGYGSQGQIYAYNAAPNMSNCTFANSSNYDLYYTGTVGGTVSGCTLNSGIRLMATSTVEFTGNTFTQNNSYPIRAYADNVHNLVNGNSFEGLDENSHLEINGGNVTKDATWTGDIPYLMAATMAVRGTDGTDGITSLTIAPGAELRFNHYLQLNVGASSGDPGALIAQGTEADPIIFTSSQPTPAPGNWRGIKFYNTADDSTSALSYCMVQYAGHGNQGLVYLNNAKPKISYSTFRFSSHAGVYAYGSGSSDAEITCNTFVDNSYGVYSAVSALPLIHQNNFSGNANYGVYNGSSQTVNAENNWWNDALGPNTNGDATQGNVDADPWSTQENQCIAAGENHPPNTPTAPIPDDNSVRVSITNGLNLSWAGGDPDPLDTVTYDLYRGTAADTLILNAQDLAGTEHIMSDLAQGITYYWQVVAEDSEGATITGPVWRFTTDGGPPDLTISNLSVDPAGNLQLGQAVTFTVTVYNDGGPVLETFIVDFLVDSVSIGTHQFDPVLYKGDSVQTTQLWNYAGGNPTIEFKADSLSQVAENIETNNSFNAALLSLVDNAAPDLVNTLPTDSAQLQQLQTITATLSDSKSTVDDAAVIASFSVTDSGQQNIAGTTTEANDTFTFVPSTLPLPDSTYQVMLSATDTHGNANAHSFNFTIDTQPPAKPVITGGTVSSGTIQPRPVQNTADQFFADLTGTREAGTSVWIDGVQVAAIGDAGWSSQLLLKAGQNAFEVWLVDRAGNQGASEWVDIEVLTSSSVNYEYDATGRIKRIDSNQ